MSGRVVSINVSPQKGDKKHPVAEVQLIAGRGIKGDAHAGEGSRQVSLLSVESIEKMRAKGLELHPGDFAENITTENSNLLSLKIGDKIRIGDSILLEVTEIGKVCHDRCAIYQKVGDCVMPREGIFTKVISGGIIKTGDGIENI